MLVGVVVWEFSRDRCACPYTMQGRNLFGISRSFYMLLYSLKVGNWVLSKDRRATVLK